MTLTLYRSNRTERLCNALADQLRHPTECPMRARWLVVQGHGMGAFLAQQLSARLGVWGGARLLYPRNFMREVMLRTLPAEACVSSLVLQRETLMWRIFKLLPEVANEAWAEPLRRYVGQDTGGTRKLHLAQQIAAAFDQYQTYRPDWLEAWSQPEEAAATHHGKAWQAQLWRCLMEQGSLGYLAQMESEFHRSVAQSARLDLPSPINLFGLSTMPPLYVRLLVSLARRVDVSLYILSPDANYYGEHLSVAQRRRAAQHAAAAELHLAHVHPLIAGLGKVGADFFDTLINETGQFELPVHEVDLFEASDCPGRLGRVQRSLLGVSDAIEPKGAVGDTDESSLRVHSCHGPMREVEVLHDQLLAELNDSDVEPQDVVVMMSDVQTYAPLVDAVFGRHRGSSKFIPYRIVDKTLRGESLVAESLLQLLALGDSRFEASKVLDVLKLEPVSERFGIGPKQCADIEVWLGEMRVAWALDEEHRQKHDQPAVRQNTWRYGLDRVLLGYAMSGHDHERFAGVAPYDPVEVAEPEVLAAFVAYCELLFDLEKFCASSWTFGVWQKRVLSLLENSIGQNDKNLWEHRRVSDALAAVEKQLKDADFDPTMASQGWTLLLQNELEQPAPMFGFRGGGVTCCAMVPMRAIPFKLVCMLGMGDKSFPRLDQRSSFDLMSKSAGRVGDRSRRDDDRYLFLEALLSARRQLLVFYSGQSVRDNSEMPASVVLSELVDFVAPQDPSFVIRHRLQPFSERYFDGSDERLFSYEDGYLGGLKKRRAGLRLDQADFFDQALDGVEDEAIQLAELRAFYAAPVRYLMSRRLGVDLRDFRRELDDREPMQLSALAKSGFGTRLLELCADGVSDTSQQLAALGLLPLGAPGQRMHRNQRAVVQELLKCLQSQGARGESSACEVDVLIDPCARLVGQVGQRFETGRVVHRFGAMHARYLLQLWVDHLAMAVSGSATPSRFVGLDKRQEPAVLGLRPVDEPLTELKKLVEIYRQGLAEPLLLFPEASKVYAETYRRLDGGPKAAEAALKSARDSYTKRDLKDDAHLCRVFGSRDVLGGEKGCFGAPSFPELALQVFGPILDHCEEGMG